jgi:hypothetical protein
MNAGTVNWQAAANTLPDCEINCLIAYRDDDGTAQACEGYLDEITDAGAPLWRDVTAWPVPGVYAWADMPEPPQAAQC